MHISKRISWLLLVMLPATFGIFVSSAHSGNQSSEQQSKKVQVLRRKDQVGVRPTTNEIHDEEPPPRERILENEIPKHVPIKIKVKREREFKDLNNDKWARGFELEVTNTGDKRIYFLSVLLITDVIAAGGYRIIFPLSFGRVELGDIRVKADANDVFLAPGETWGLTIHPGQLAAWEMRNREENRPHPKKIRVKQDMLSFGDGTGFGPGGVALPRKVQKSATTGGASARAAPRWEWSGKAGPANNHINYRPASSLPVFFCLLPYLVAFAS